MNRLDAFIIRSQLKWQHFLSDLRNDERGLSGVVVAVLLILVAVLAVVLIWSLLGQSIKDWWNTITEKAEGGLT